MFNKLFSSLAKKIFFAVGAALSISGGIFVYVAHQTGYMMLESQVREKAHDIATVSEAVLATAMTEEKHNHLREFLQALNSSHQFADVFILRRDGTVYCSTDTLQQEKNFLPEQFGDTAQWSSERFISRFEQGSTYEYIVTPIVKYPTCYRCHTLPESNRGYLTVKLSMDEVRATALKHRATNILMIIGTFFGVGGVIIITLLFVIVRPMRSIHRQIKNLEGELESVERGEAGQFSQLQVPSSKDEITDLIFAFNRLTRRLNEVYGKLHELHQKELEHADRLASAGEMAASVAHEIRNPVAGVLGALQVFESEVPEGDERKEILKEMKQQLDRVNQAVSDLLSYARPTPPVYEEFPINEVIQRTVSLLARQLKGRQIDIQLRLSDKKTVISADKKQVQQVLWNLILNALQAMDTTGTLIIESLPEDSYVKICVSDTGRGIPEELADRVFEPFFTTKHKGTGLGMTISKRIIEQHKGSISLVSRVNQGTTVTLVMPLHQEGE